MRNETPRAPTPPHPTTEFIEVPCRQNLGTPQQILGQQAIRELDEIVEYANRFHHDTNPARETSTINNGELRGFVERTLRFCRR